MNETLKALLINLALWVFIAVCVCILAFANKALGYELLQPKSVSIEGEKYDVLRDPYVPEGKAWVYGIAVGNQITLLGDRTNDWRLFFDSKLSFRATEEQIRYGSLYYETGGEILQERGLRIFRRHYSGHVLEYGRDSRQYPLLDSWVCELRWEFK